MKVSTYLKGFIEAGGSGGGNFGIQSPSDHLIQLLTLLGCDDFLSKMRSGKVVLMI